MYGRVFNLSIIKLEYSKLLTRSSGLNKLIDHSLAKLTNNACNLNVK